ncbi:transposase, partial [Burkholderia ubonensis]|uniref:transposase n=1 Tax=Burkholderia ubonensis TaxID=101571 RepID=UPI0039F64361
MKSSKRPNFADEFKRALVEQTFEPDASVSLVARCNDINTNLLFRWRRQYLEGAFGPPRPEHVGHQKPTDGILNRPGFVGDRRVWRYAARASSACCR